MKAHVRAQQREAARQAKEFDRRNREKAQARSRDAAAAEVAEFEQALADLQGFHKTHSAEVDWNTLAPKVNPHQPIRKAHHRLHFDLSQIINPGAVSENRSDEPDEALYTEELAAHTARLEEIEDLRIMAEGLLAGDLETYTAVLETYTPFKTVEEVGAEISVQMYDSNCMGLNINLPGRSVVSEEIKSLSASGKVVSKAMTKGMAQAIYHDFVCSCILRVALESFAWLPLKNVVVTAFVQEHNPATGHVEPVPVLSVALPREILQTLNLQTLDPSDSMENFIHTGVLKTSKKTGAFLKIEPLGITPFSKSNDIGGVDAATYQPRLIAMRKELQALLGNNSRRVAQSELEEETI